MKTDPAHSKHNKVHLLIISETGRVKSRKISLRFIKWVVGIFLLFFVLTSVFTYLYLRDLKAHRFMKNASADLAKEMEILRDKAEEQAMEIKRLQGVAERLNRENRDLKRHIISRKALKKQGTNPAEKQKRTNKNLAAFREFLSKLGGMKGNSPDMFHIREPRIEVTEGESKVSFNLYKNTLKKMAGKIVLLGIYKPENFETVGKVAAFPSRSFMSYKIRPAYGRYFRIEKQFLPFEAKLTHPEGVSRFSEFHVLVYGLKRELLFHEQFKAP